MVAIRSAVVITTWMMQTRRRGFRDSAGDGSKLPRGLLRERRAVNTNTPTNSEAIETLLLKPVNAETDWSSRCGGNRYGRQKIHRPVTIHRNVLRIPGGRATLPSGE